MPNESLKETLALMTKEISYYAAQARASGRRTQSADLFLIDMIMAYGGTFSAEEAESMLHKGETIRRELKSFTAH